MTPSGAPSEKRPARWPQRGKASTRRGGKGPERPPLGQVCEAYKLIAPAANFQVARAVALNRGQRDLLVLKCWGRPRVRNALARSERDLARERATTTTTTT